MQRKLHALFLISFIFCSSWQWLGGQSPTQALEFDGVNDYLEVADDPSLDFDAADDLFIEFWFKTSNNNPNKNIGIVNKMENFLDGLTGYSVSMSNDGEIVIAKIHTAFDLEPFDILNGNLVITTSDDFNDGDWHHIAVDLSGTTASNYKIWVDGIEQPTDVVLDNLNGSTVNNSPLRIGGYIGATNATSFFTDGQIDELRIWNTARTEQQVRENRYQQIPNMTTNTDLAAYYSFDDLVNGTGTAADLSPNTNEADLINSPDIVESLLAHSRASTDFMLNQQNGVRTINGLQLDDTPNPFNNPQDIYVTVVDGQPNTDEDIGQLETADQYYIIDLFEAGGPAEFYDMDITFPCAACPDGEDVNLYNRASNSTGAWSAVGGPEIATSGIVTFDNVSFPGQFILAANSLVSVSPLAIDFSGNEGYVSIKDAPSITFTTAGELFIEFWIRTTTDEQIPVINKLAGFDGFTVNLDEGDKIYLRKERADIFAEGVATAAFDDGEWHHIAVDLSTGNSANYRAWMDGVELTVTPNGSLNGDITNDQPLRIGRQFTTNKLFADAQMDEVRVYNASRTTEQVRTYMFQQPDPASEPSLVAYYTFDDIAGITYITRDFSGNGNVGDLVDKPATAESLIDFAKASTESALNEADGVRTLSGVALDDAAANGNDPFDAPQDIYVTRVEGYPNVTTGIPHALIANTYYIILIFGNGTPAGTFAVDLTIPCGNCVDGKEVFFYQRNSNSTGPWMSAIPPYSGLATGGVVTIEDVVSFGQGILASNETALPVELTYFTGRPGDAVVDLYWQTATELNNAGFEVQKLENEKWVKLAFVDGAGTSYVVQNYTYRDQSPLSGMNYYRLKQIDFDGQFVFSDVVGVRMEDRTKTDKIQVFPNPTANGVHFILPPEIEADATLRLYDQMGRLVISKAAQEDAGYLPMENLAPGIYLLELSDRYGQWRERVVKE